MNTSVANPATFVHIEHAREARREVVAFAAYSRESLFNIWILLKIGLKFKKTPMLRVNLGRGEKSKGDIVCIIIHKNIKQQV